MDISKANKIIADSEKAAQNLFRQLADIALYNQEKVLNAFINNHIGYNHFHPTSGYGYDDLGRDTLNKVFADVFGCEDALVSPLIANGTHALTIALFGLLRPNDLLLSIAGQPYETLESVIKGDNNGSLKEFGVQYQELDLLENGSFDFDKIISIIKNKSPKVIFIQRSKGYLWREALAIAKIAEVITCIKTISPDTIVVVDNCYGEFTATKEPTDVGADVIVGSLIKNPGGGIAPTGGYIAGKKDLIEQISYRFTTPSLGREVGSYASGYRLFYQGLFMAPSIVKNALMGNVLTSYALSFVDIKTMPRPGDMPYDIINSIKFDTPEGLKNFCRTIQAVSPVESYVTPEAWDMPGYPNQVIMAAGTFIEGATLELSADGTIRQNPPYIAYLQGGLTYEHYKLAITKVLQYNF